MDLIGSMKLFEIIFAASAVTSAFFAAVSQRVFHSALFLFITLGSIAGLFFMLGAEFPAILQILLYVGGVAVLIVFAIMMTPAREEDRTSPLVKWSLLPMLGIGVLTSFLVYLFYRYKNFFDSGRVTGDDYDSMMRMIAENLFDKYFLPFEILSVTLLVAVVGALFLARKREG
ncbi:MAG: NADH-quinone oxidoreductase subunit J [Planctomycetota bacterium]|nr:NADH-quinone oxidoreductase subunit J [Planctomycetota bacterium]